MLRVAMLAACVVLVGGCESCITTCDRARCGACPAPIQLHVSRASGAPVTNVVVTGGSATTVTCGGVADAGPDVYCAGNAPAGPVMLTVTADGEAPQTVMLTVPPPPTGSCCACAPEARADVVFPM